MADSGYWSRASSASLSRRRILRGGLAASAGLLGAALVGCNSGGGNTKQSSAPAAGNAATQGIPSNVRVGGRLTETFSSSLPSFDFHKEVTAAAPGALMPAFNQLLKFDTLTVEQTHKAVVGDLAEKWEIAPDGQTYTFHLVKNAKFHDGTPFTAADVKASFERQLNPPAGLVMPRGSQIRAIKAMEMPDAYTFTLKLGRPVSPLSLLPILAQAQMCIYSQKDIAAKYDFQTKINGTGPFRLKSADLTSKISYDKNKDYHIKGRPYLDGIDLYNIPDASTLIAQVQAGAINIVGTSVAQFATLKQVLGDKAKYQTVKLQTVSALNMNPKRAPFIDERVRRAIALAYNKGDAIKVLQQGEGDVGGYMFPSGAWALSQSELEQLDGYRPYTEAGLADAKKMVAAAGVKPGAEFTLLTATGQENVNLFLADQLKKLDIKANLKVIDYAKQYDDLNGGNFDAFIISLAFFVDDPDSVYADHFLTDSPINYTRVGSKAIDDLFIKQSTELNPQRRAELVKDMEKLALPMMSKLIFFYSRNRIVTQKVNDFVWPNHMGSNHRMQDVWLDA